MSVNYRLGGPESNTDTIELVERASVLVTALSLAAMIAASVLAYSLLPESMTIQWRMGIDGTVTTRAVGTTLGATFLPAFAATTWVGLRVLGAWLESYDDVARALCSLAAAVTVALLGLTHLLVIGLNLV